MPEATSLQEGRTLLRSDLFAKGKGKHVDRILVEKAVNALIKHHEQKVRKDEGQKLSLLGTDSQIQVQLGLERAPEKTPKRPIRVDIPHALHKLVDSDDEGVEEPDVCLIVKDGEKEWIAEMITRFKDHMGCVKKVLELQSLRKKHSLFSQRRDLLHKYDVFLADDRILPMLPSALGREFFKAKKLPIPLAITRKSALPFAIQKSLASTFMTLSPGTCITIRTGNTGMSQTKLVDNILAITENAPQKIPRKWANVRSISIKTPSSVALPIYNKTPEELYEIAKKAGYKDELKKAVDPIKDTETLETGQKSKVETKSKSPLVRSIEKVKEMKTQDGDKAKTKKTKTEDGDNKKTKTSQEKLKSNKVTNEEKKKDGDNKKTKTSQEKLKSNKVNDEEKKKKRSDGNANSSSDSHGKEGNKISKEEKKRKRSAEKSISSSDSNKKEEAEDKPKKIKSKEAADQSTPNQQSKSVKTDFIASSRFKGSKDGYVFRNGSSGVGYYIDVKPVVDKMALADLARLGQKGKGRRQEQRGKRKGRSRR